MNRNNIIQLIQDSELFKEISKIYFMTSLTPENLYMEKNIPITSLFLKRHRVSRRNNSRDPVMTDKKTYSQRNYRVGWKYSNHTRWFLERWVRKNMLNNKHKGVP